MKFDPEVNPILDFISLNPNPAETRDYAYKNAIDFYNKKKYFEAHEIFEFQWKKENGDRKIFTQALIQISVAMNKVYVNINLKGAYSQASLALEKLLLLQTRQVFTGKGLLFSESLIKNLKCLLELLNSNKVAIGNYSPPDLSEILDDLLP